MHRRTFFLATCAKVNVKRRALSLMVVTADTWRRNTNFFNKKKNYNDNNLKHFLSFSLTVPGLTLPMANAF